MSKKQSRKVFFISDGTAITAETLGRSLLIQFKGMSFHSETIPFVNTIEKAHAAAACIRNTIASDSCLPLVFSTLLDPQQREIFSATGAKLFDLFDLLVGPLEEAVGCDFSHTVGGAHSMLGGNSYFERVAATEYALAHDDGLGVKNFSLADVILTGVSRAGKTPTSLYLSLQFGIKAANYPLTEDELDPPHLPNALIDHKDKLFGLTIQPEQLARIREGRTPDSRYASLAQCRYEVSRTESLFRAEAIPFLDSTAVSIEELASLIVQQKSLNRSGL